MCAVVSDSLVTCGGNAEAYSQLISPLKVIQNTNEVQFLPLKQYKKVCSLLILQ